MYYFVIVNQDDVALYEKEWETKTNADNPTEIQDRRHLNQLIAHAALDLVDETIKLNNFMHLKRIDKFNEYWRVVKSNFQFLRHFFFWINFINMPL